MAEASAEVPIQSPRSMDKFLDNNDVLLRFIEVTDLETIEALREIPVR